MAMKVDSKRFREELSSVNAAMIDSNILIYHLEDLEPYSELTEILFTRLGEGRLKLIVSTLSVTELMAKPYAEGNLKRITASVSFMRSTSFPQCRSAHCRSAGISGRAYLLMPMRRACFLWPFSRESPGEREEAGVR